MVLSLAEAHGFYICTSGIRQAHLQTREPLGRDIRITKPVPEFSIHLEQCLKLLKSLYELWDSRDLWHSTLDEHHRNPLDMCAMRAYPDMYFMEVDGKISRLRGTYVVDILRAGKPFFVDLCKKTAAELEIVDEEETTASCVPIFPLPENSIVQLITGNIRQ